MRKKGQGLNWRRVYLLFLAMAIVISIFGQLLARDEASDEDRYRRFSRGINLPYWFWLNSGPLKPLEKKYSDEDLSLIRKLGLTYVRVPVDMANIYAAGREDKLNPEALELLLAGLKRLLIAGWPSILTSIAISQKEGGSDYSGPLGKDATFTEEFFRFLGKTG